MLILFIKNLSTTSKKNALVLVNKAKAQNKIIWTNLRSHLHNFWQTLLTPYNLPRPLKVVYIATLFCTFTYFPNCNSDYTVYMTSQTFIFFLIITLLSTYFLCTCIVIPCFEGVNFFFKYTVHYMRCSGVDFAHEKASCILVGPRLPHTDYWDQVRSAVTDVQACSTLAKEQRGIEKRKDILNPQLSLADCSKTRIKGALSELEYSVHCLDHPESIELLDSLIHLNWTPPRRVAGVAFSSHLVNFHHWFNLNTVFDLLVPLLLLD